MKTIRKRSCSPFLQKNLVMSNNRRDFIKKSASLATITSMGSIGSVLPSKKFRGYAKDAGMQLSEAYFRGLEQRRIDYCLQMNVLGAVTGVRTEGDVKPWEAKAIIANKAAWDNAGLKWNVVEGPPALGEKTKLGLEGRDEEISNFITFMKNLKQHAGVDIICYNWMPVIGWFRTNNAKPGRGRALMTAFDFE